MRKIATILISIFSLVTLSAQGLSYEDRFTKAIIQFSLSNYDKASIEFNALHAADSTDGVVSYYLGVCEHVAGRSEVAKSLLDKALASDPSNVWYKDALANLLLDMNDYVGAAYYIETLIDEIPAQYNNSRILYLLGSVKLQQQLPASASDYFSRSLSLEPDYAPSLLGKAHSELVQGNLASFFAHLDKYVYHDGIEAENKVKFISGFMENVDASTYWLWNKKITSVVDTLACIHPESFDAQELRMQISYINRDTVSILDCCDRMEKIALSQDNKEQAARAVTNKGDLFYTSGDESEAFKMYRVALGYYPDYAPALNNYAYYLSVKGRSLTKALKMSKRSVELEPDNPNYLDTYGWLLHQKGRDAEAKPFFKHALLYGGRDSKVVLEHYSEVLRCLGENDLADYYKHLSQSKK